MRKCPKMSQKNGQKWLKDSPQSVNRQFSTFCFLHFFSLIALNGTFGGSENVGRVKRGAFFLTPICIRRLYLETECSQCFFLSCRLLRHDVISFEDCAFGNHIDAQVQFGLPCLLENVDENLDPGLGPILLKQVAAQHRYDDHCEQYYFYVVADIPTRRGGLHSDWGECD